MKFYLKQSFVPFFYLMFTALTAFSITLIGNNLMWLKVILLILNVGLYGSVISLTSFKDGQIAYGVRQTNDADREIIVKTGEYRELRLVEEYKPWKGFIHGLIASLPLVILLIIHTIVLLTNPEMATKGTEGITVGSIASFIYATFFLLFNVGGATTVYTCYLALFSIPIIALFTGIPYILGAKSAEKNYRKAFELKKNIYGDKH